MDAAVLHDEPQAYTRNSHTELDSMQTSGVMESSGDGPVFSSSGAGGEDWELLLRQIYTGGGGRGGGGGVAGPRRRHRQPRGGALPQ